MWVVPSQPVAGERLDVVVPAVDAKVVQLDAAPQVPTASTQIVSLVPEGPKVAR
jgi:hypothetical protein